MLDVNAGIAGGNEVEALPWLIQLVQKEVSIPLMIDSANPEALKAALTVYRHTEPPILNSISGEEEKCKRLFPVIAERKSKLHDGANVSPGRRMPGRGDPVGF
jgi:5-methyltetrahydrofolate--homocysteine methyltransferase